MTTPKRGRTARPKSRRPVLALLDLLGRRWALRIIWELREDALSSRLLAARCGGVSPTVLHKRLRELRAAHVVDLQQPSGYALSSEGAALVALLRPLEVWAERSPRRPAMETTREAR
jgi:DNA-binding HxlR family transcriptional regulator